MSVTRKEFGTTLAGQETKLYSIGNREGELTVKVSDFGATVVSVLVPDKEGRIRDVVLGYDNAAGYESGKAYFGALVGRCANRIKDGEFLINGKRYILVKNEGNNNLHSGPDTWNKRLWKAEAVDKDAVKMSLFSPDLDQGFPGDADVTVTYAVRGNRFEIDYEVRSDRDTIVNCTNHSYFNLLGHDGGAVLGHLVRINASYYTETDAENIPTGNLLPVEGTPYDFRTRKTVGRDLAAQHPQTGGYPVTYDDNFAIDDEGFRMAGNAYASESGILMNIYTDLPGMQLYSPPKCNVEGKHGAIYRDFGALCFETQYFPDAVHVPHFAGPILRAGETWHSKTVYEFETVKV